MRIILLSLLAFISLSSAIVTKDQVDKIFALNPNIPPEYQPTIIDDTNYDSLVVDSTTTEVYPGLPWFIFFYLKRCPYSREFKPVYDNMT